MNSMIFKTIEYLNSIANTDYSPNYPETLKSLTQLIESGYGLQDFKNVIDKKWEQWKGTKYQMYVRPSTLFGKNFENYLNEPRTTKTNQFTKLINSVQRAKSSNWRLGSGRK
jgi:uncharacterized phage protein (TIGR02220 family)